jgi:hypothetical protein
VVQRPIRRAAKLDRSQAARLGCEHVQSLPKQPGLARLDGGLLRHARPSPLSRSAAEPPSGSPATDPHAILRPIDPADPMAGLEAKVIRWDLVPHSWRQPITAKKFLATNARS